MCGRSDCARAAGAIASPATTLRAPTSYISCAAPISSGTSIGQRSRAAAAKANRRRAHGHRGAGVEASHCRPGAWSSVDGEAGDVVGAAAQLEGERRGRRGHTHSLTLPLMSNSSSPAAVRLIGDAPVAAPGQRRLPAVGVVGSRCSGWRCTWRRTGRWCCPCRCRRRTTRRRCTGASRCRSLAGRLGLFLGDVRPWQPAGDRAGPAGRVEAVVGAGRVVARRLVGEHRDVAGRGEVDQLVVGGAVGRRVQLVDLAVAVVVQAVADLGRPASSSSPCSGGCRPRVVADPGARAGARARADRAAACRCRTARRPGRRSRCPGRRSRSSCPRGPGSVAG